MEILIIRILATLLMIFNASFMIGVGMVGIVKYRFLDKIYGIVGHIVILVAIWR